MLASLAMLNETFSVIFKHCELVKKNWKPNDVVPYCKVAAAAVVFYVTIVSLGNAKSSFPATIIGNRDYSAHSRRRS